MENELENQNYDDIWEDVKTWGKVLVTSYFVGKEINKAIVNGNRRETALDEFERQDLSWWDNQCLKAFFKDHDFYVTKFPDTPKDIFPLAVEILYQLIEYHSNPKPNRRLGSKILENCEKLHRIALKKRYKPISLRWKYWKLVQKEVMRRGFWGELKQEKEFISNPNWNLEDFLNEFENGIIRHGIFGVKEKRIDFCYYRKAEFGRLVDRQEVDETTIQISNVWDFIRDGKYVIEIYDAKTSKFFSAFENEKEDTILASERTRIDITNPIHTDSIIRNFKEAVDELIKEPMNIKFNYTVQTLEEAIELLNLGIDTVRSYIDANSRSEKHTQIREIFSKILTNQLSTLTNRYGDSAAKFGYALIHPREDTVIPDIIKNLPLDDPWNDIELKQEQYYKFAAQIKKNQKDEYPKHLNLRHIKFFNHPKDADKIKIDGHIFYYDILGKNEKFKEKQFNDRYGVRRE